MFLFRTSCVSTTALLSFVVAGTANCTSLYVRQTSIFWPTLFYVLPFGVINDDDDDDDDIVGVYGEKPQ